MNGVGELHSTTLEVTMDSFFSGVQLHFTIDQNIDLYDLKANKKILLLSCGSSKGIDEVFWVTENKLLLVGTQYSDVKKPIIIIVDFENSDLSVLPNYLIKNTDLFESIFKEILARATKCGFVDSSNIYIDSTHIKASANKKKYTKVEVDIQAKHYQEKLEKEINEDRLKHGKSPLCEVKNEEVKKKEKIESNTDKDSGMFFKNEKEKCFAYLAHTACDNNNFILDFHITSGNIHDSVAFSDLYQKIKNK